VRRALELSLNAATVHLLNKLSPKVAWNFITMLGITSKKPKYLDLSLALGCYEVVPAELINAYATFCNNGVYFPLISILKIYDNHNNLLEEHIPVGKRVISEESAYILTHLLKGVVERGTARALRGVFPCEVAAKTGTSDTYADAWFIGYTPDLVVGVWVGNDSQRISLGPGCSGAVVALPIWKEFLLNAFKKNILSFKKKKFDVPPQIKFYKICPQSNALARQGCPQKIEEAFSISQFNSLFLSYCNIHPGLPADYNEIKEEVEEDLTSSQEVEEELTPSEELSSPY
jgi:membrane carboxypeptidase/penicillin-binding protein